jgi:hypothetical protein
MKTVLASDPGDGRDDGDGRRYIPLTLDSFRRPDNFVWSPCECQPLADAIALQVTPGGLVPGDGPRPADDHSMPFLRGTRTEDLMAAIDSIEREGRLYPDSGVDLVRVVDGQVLVAQVKMRASMDPVLAEVLKPYQIRPGAAVLIALLVALIVSEWLVDAPIFVKALAPIGGFVLPALLLRLVRAAKNPEDRKLLARFSARGLTDLAILLAGRRRPALRVEWCAHLAGESGHDPVTWPKVREAVGFVASAVQYRLADAADAAWIPVDAILKSRKLSNLLVFGPTCAAALCILRHLGTLGVLTSAESISAIGGGLYGLVRVGRWWRDVKPPEPKARRVREQ